jgi:serine/threonine-protein kinase
LIATPNLTRIQNPVLSPDASRIAFVGEGRLYVHDLTNTDSRELADTAGAANPFWSPDSQWVGYFDRTRMFKISVNGGAPVPIVTLPAECPVDVCGASWTNEGRILVGTGDATIVSVPEGGGDWSSYLEPDENEHFHSVTALPGGQGALFYVDPDEDAGRFDLLIDGERVRGPAAAGFSPLAYSTDGYLLFEGPERNGVWAVPFEPTNVGPFGEPLLLLPGAGYPSLGRGATLLVVRPPERVHQLVWVDRQGVVREVVDEARPLAIEPRLSPDGSRIALTSTDGDGSSVLVLEPSKGARRWLARSSRPVNFSNSPAWTADGERLLSVEPGSTGSDTEETIIRIQTLEEDNSETLIRGFDPEESRDGRYLAYSAGTFIERDIFYLDHQDPLPEPRVFLEEPGIQGMHEFSPDSRYIAFLHSDTGMTGLEVYLSPFPGGGSRLQVSSGGVTVATQIRWRSDGERLYYLRASDGMLMEVELDLVAKPELSPPKELFTGAAANLNLMRGFDVARDGERFLVTKATVPPGGDRGGVFLIQNWLDLLPSRP